MEAASQSHRRDPEAGFAVADPGKAWRRGHRIPVVAAFDGYRGWAVLGVVLFHVFEISGAFKAMRGLRARRPLLGDPAAEHPGALHHQRLRDLPAHRGPRRRLRRLSSFAIRRAARLIPAYYVVLLLAVVLLLIVPTSLPVPGPGTIAAHFAVLQTPALLVTANFQLGFGVVPPVWTLSVEVGFYVVLPFVAARTSAIRWWGWLTAAAILVAWRVVATTPTASPHRSVPISAQAHRRIASVLREPVPELGVRDRNRDDRGLGIHPAPRPGRRPGWLERPASGALSRRSPLAACSSIWTGHEAVTGSIGFEGLFARESVSAPARLLRWRSGIYARLHAGGRAGAATGHRRRRCAGSATSATAIYLIHFAVIWVVLNEFSLPGGGGIASGVGVVRDRVPDVHRLCVPLRPVPRETDPTLGPPLRATGRRAPPARAAVKAP